MTCALVATLFDLISLYLSARESRRLFKYVDESVFNLPTYKTFKNLLDNYIPQVGIPEKVDANELRENAAFIKEVMNTVPMIYVHKVIDV